MDIFKEDLEEITERQGKVAASPLQPIWKLSAIEKRPTIQYLGNFTRDKDYKLLWSA